MNFSLLPDAQTELDDAFEWYLQGRAGAAIRAYRRSYKA
jgi:hypothetical protein